MVFHCYQRTGSTEKLQEKLPSYFIYIYIYHISYTIFHFFMGRITGRYRWFPVKMFPKKPSKIDVRDGNVMRGGGFSKWGILKSHHGFQFEPGLNVG